MSKKDDRNEAAMRRVLYSVCVGGMSRWDEIAKECGLSGRTTTRQLGKLVERGLLVSVKRKYFVTEKGKEAAEKLKKELQTEKQSERNDSPPASS
jgi:predicted transcriptional regulator